jgi:hypothetical protein
MKEDSASCFLKISLKVPRGLWLFLQNLERVGGPNPKEHLELVLSKELECILGDLPDDTFNMEFLRTRYGEGSDVYHHNEANDKAKG